MALRKIVFGIMISSALGTSLAQAGSWQYGCMGRTAAGERLIFNRSDLVMLSPGLLGSDASAVTSDDIRTFVGVDGNSGFESVMRFTHQWEGGALDTLTLKELASKEVSNVTKTVPCGPGRIREISKVVFKKVYEMELKSSGSDSTKEKLSLSCYENMVTSCG